MNNEILNAEITYVKWNRERGLTQWIGVSAEGWGCALGGYHLSEDCAYKWIMKLMDIFDLCEFCEKDIVGKIVRCKIENNRIIAIGHPFKNIWLDPKELFD